MNYLVQEIEDNERKCKKYKGMCHKYKDIKKSLKEQEYLFEQLKQQLEDTQKKVSSETGNGTFDELELCKRMTSMEKQIHSIKYNTQTQMSLQNPGFNIFENGLGTESKKSIEFKGENTIESQKMKNMLEAFDGFVSFMK